MVAVGSIQKGIEMLGIEPVRRDRSNGEPGCAPLEPVMWST